MTGVLRSAVRAGAFVRKEFAEALRQPRLLVTLVLGPFAILVVFGAGLRTADPPFQTLFVAPPEHELAEEVSEFAREQAGRLTVEGVVQDEAAALRQLETGAVDLVVVFPSGVDEKVRANEQGMITMYHNQLDPIEEQAIQLYMLHAVDEINQQVLASVIAEGQEDSEELRDRVTTARERLGSAREAADRGDDGQAAVELAQLRSESAALLLAAGPAAAVMEGVRDQPGAGGNEDDDSLHEVVTRFAQRVEDVDDPDDLDEDGDELDADLEEMETRLAEFESISPEILVAPFGGQVARLAGDAVDLDDFYASAVVVVLLQHMLITLVALSLVRETELGTPELYRVAPLRIGELALGKQVAHIGMGVVVAAVLVLALVFALGVPMLGSWLMLSATLLALLLASAGLGLCVAAVSRSDSQAVQYTMLLLLATIFFSGFTLSLERFIPEVSWVGLVLPATSTRQDTPRSSRHPENSWPTCDSNPTAPRAPRIRSSRDRSRGPSWISRRAEAREGTADCIRLPAGSAHSEGPRCSCTSSSCRSPPSPSAASRTHDRSRPA